MACLSNSHTDGSPSLITRRACKVSTLRVAAAAIARNHKVAGFDVTFRHGTARAALDKLTREEVPSGRLRRRQERHKARLFGA